MRQVEENISPKLFLRSCIQLANTTGFILRVTVEFEALGVKCNTLSDHRAQHTPRVACFCSGVHKLLDIVYEHLLANSLFRLAPVLYFDCLETRLKTSNLCQTSYRRMSKDKPTLRCFVSCWTSLSHQSSFIALCYWPWSCKWISVPEDERSNDVDATQESVMCFQDGVCLPDSWPLALLIRHCFDAWIAMQLWTSPPSMTPSRVRRGAASARSIR